MKFGDRLVGDDCDPRPGAQCLDPLTQIREQTTANRDVVSPRIQRDPHNARLGLSQ